MRSQTTQTSQSIINMSNIYRSKTNADKRREQRVIMLQRLQLHLSDSPMQGVSPTRPSILFSIPPVEVAQAMLPSLSTATAPTVPIFPLLATKHTSVCQLGLT